MRAYHGLLVATTLVALVAAASAVRLDALASPSFVETGASASVSAEMVCYADCMQARKYGTASAPRACSEAQTFPVFHCNISHSRDVWRVYAGPNRRG